MTMRHLRALAAAAMCLLSVVRPALADGSGTLFRVFLNNGGSLVSYGEIARVGDRVVFSMPTSASSSTPQLQLVNIAADRVDWNRTLKYADSARATDYLATQAAADYALVSNSVAEALNEIAHTEDPARRLAIVQKARQTLAEWPPHHYNYKQDEVRQMLGILDEAVADLQARTGDRFNLSLVASASPPVVIEPLLPPPTPREAIEQTLMAATLADSPAERMSLLNVALGGMMRDADSLAPEWLGPTIDATRTQIDAELKTDRAYTSLTTRMLAAGRQRARSADVRGLQTLIARVHAEDRVLGSKRRDMVGALVDSLQVQLDAARRLQLERDRWMLRQTDFHAYNSSVSGPLGRLSALKPWLEDIKALSGSDPRALGLILNETQAAMKTLSGVMPPEEFRSAHAMLLSAVQLADSAARTRREAALIGSIPRAWDASSAAAGALMLTERARTDIQALLKLPELPQTPQ